MEFAVPAAATMVSGAFGFAAGATLVVAKPTVRHSEFLGG
jgi:hypothetical protein